MRESCGVIGAVVVTLFMPVLVWATDVMPEGFFVEVSTENHIYVEHLAAKKGHPTVILPNGLTYSTEEWDPFTLALREINPNLGIVRYDMTGMGQTMKRRMPKVYKIPVELQTEELNSLLDQLRLWEPVHLVGLSYGGGVAAHFASVYPERVANIVLMAPYVAPITDQHEWILSQIRMSRRVFPWSFLLSGVDDEHLYDYFFRHIVLTFPFAESVLWKEPIILPYKLEMLFHLSKGIRHFKTVDIVDQLPAGSLHMVIAPEDQYIQPEEYEEVWAQTPPEVRGSRLFVLESEHKIPQVVPMFSAEWVNRIVLNDPATEKGNTYEGKPSTGDISACDKIMQSHSE